ncbi:MAG: NAD(P)/FAD-dependent oxidoreductase [Methanobacterium sp.]|uniref:FAD-dependent oxidoreductase n=1 Tax=Methanobacterium sp. TaxID=2164 RepID=UPI003D647475|nr:NAD(P)/FAD-dependent oxidoreductase [Methanobacterium sp.]
MDITVIGGGPAGRTASIEAASIGENVTLIEGSAIGGTCLNEGCMVVCGLNDVSKFLNDAKNFENLGIIKNNYEFSFKEVTKGVKKTVGKISHVLETETKDAGVKIINGVGKLKEDYVVLNNENLKYDKLIIATGARPFIPEIEGAENGITYKDILNLTEIPEELIIIGSGVIAAEYANIFSNMGSIVHVLCRNQFLSILDKNIKKYVTKNLLPDVNIHENLQTNKIYKDHVSTDKGEINGKVLFATGMTPNSEIAVDMVDINEKGHIIVDDGMQTSHESIYAAGDVAGKIGNTPISRAEGVIAARNACGIHSKMEYTYIPQAINLYYDVSFVSSNNKDEGVEGYIPGSAGPGSFWRVLEGMTGLTKININENRDINELYSISPSSRTSMAYISKLLKEGQNIDDFDDFIEVHPSTDAIYKLMRFFARFE